MTRSNPLGRRLAKEMIETKQIQVPNEAEIGLEFCPASRKGKELANTN